MSTVRRYFENGKSIVSTQQDFRTHFDIPCHETIPDRNTIFKWVTAFNTTGTVVINRTNDKIGILEHPKTWTELSGYIAEPQPFRPFLLRSTESTVRWYGKCDLAFHSYKV